MTLSFLPELLAAILAIMALSTLAPQSGYTLNIFMQAATYAVAVAGLVVVLGYCGQISLAQAAFFGLGAYGVALGTVDYGLPFFVALGAGMALAAVFGVLLGGSFAPNHKGMPIVPKNAKVDFLRRQVLMSRNIRGGRVTDFMMGGLNYQIEHHLFPSMPRCNLRHAQPVVRRFCAERGVPYAEAGAGAAYVAGLRHLHAVGSRLRERVAA